MVDFSTYNIKGGLNLKDKPAMLGETEFSELTNFVVENGVLNVREGYAPGTSLPHATGIHGLYEYIDNTTPSNNTMLYATSTTLKNTAGTTLDSGISGSNYINFSKFSVSEKAYYVDGVSAVKSLYNNYKIEYGNGFSTGLATNSYVYMSGGNTYAVTTSASRKIERWKLTGTTWAWDKDISTALGVGNTYSCFCWDGTFYYAVRSDTLVMEKWSDTPLLSASLTIDDGIYTFPLSLYNKCVYDLLNQNIIIMAVNTGVGNYYIKCNITSGYVTHFYVASATEGDIALFNNILYYKINTSTSLIYSITTTGTFTVGASLTTNINGDKLTISNNNLVVVVHSTTKVILYFYDTNLYLTRVENPTAIIIVLERTTSVDNTVNDIYVYGRNAVGVLINYYFTYTSTLYNPHIYNSYTTYDLPIQATFTGSASGIFRTGNWYFAYSIGNYNTQSGTYDYSPLSTPVIYNVTTLSNATLVISNILTTKSLIKWYARHETESYFYSIGVSLLNSFIPTVLLTDNIYDETTVYSPPPVACTQLTSYRDMMVYVKANALYFTNYFDPINVPSTIVTDTASGLGGYYPVGKDNANITAIYQFHGYLFVFKEHSTYRITGDPGDLSTFRIDLMSSIVGVKNERCITDDGRFMYVYNDTGVYPINEVAVGQSISEKIDKEIISLYTTNTSMCYHKKLNRVMLISNAYTFGDGARTYKASIAYCLCVPSQTWSKFTQMPGGIPIMLNKLGNDLHIEDNYIYKMFTAYNDDGAGFTAIFTTKRHTTPSTAVYKRLYECDLETDGEAGMTFSSTAGIKSQAILDGSALADSSVAIYPGTASIRQKLRVAFNNCNNYALRVIASISGSNTIQHSIQSIMWRIRQKSGVR